jgi:hypothetical protein
MRIKMFATAGKATLKTDNTIVKINLQTRTLFTIIYLYQCHPYMFRWSSHHHQAVPNVTDFVLYLN